MKYKFNGVVNKEKLKTRRETIDGVKYLVAPAVMVAEAVLNGELLPAEEIQRSCEGVERQSANREAPPRR